MGCHVFFNQNLNFDYLKSLKWFFGVLRTPWSLYILLELQALYPRGRFFNSTSINLFLGIIYIIYFWRVSNSLKAIHWGGNPRFSSWWSIWDFSKLNVKRLGFQEFQKVDLDFLSGQKLEFYKRVHFKCQGTSHQSCPKKPSMPIFYQKF